MFADDSSDLSVTDFAEIDELSPNCHFRDCRHRGEPGCAVLAAVEAGQVEAERLHRRTSSSSAGNATATIHER